MAVCWQLPNSLRMGLAVRGTKAVIKLLELTATALSLLPVRGKELKINWITNGQQLVSHAYALKSPWKPKKTGFRELPDCWNTWSCWDGGAPREGMEAQCLSFILPYASLSSGCSWLVPLYKWAIVTKVLSWVLWAILTSYSTRWKGGGNLQLTAGLSEAQVTTWTSTWFLKSGRGALGNELLTSGICSYL